MKPIDIAKQCIAANEKGYRVSYPIDAEALYEFSKALESAERERDELKERLSLVRDQRDAELNKNTQLEAEIARRDAAAGEPVAWISERNLAALGRQFSVSVKHEPVMVRPVPLYTVAPPAVLPPEMVPENAHKIDAIHGVPLDLMRRCIAADAYNQCRADAIELGAQQQKPVFMPKSERINNGYYFDMDDIFVALDAAGVKYKVVK